MAWWGWVLLGWAGTSLVLVLAWAMAGPKLNRHKERGQED